MNMQAMCIRGIRCARKIPKQNARRRSESGQTLLETAITLPIVLSLVFGTFALTVWYYQQAAAAVSAANAARVSGIARGDIGVGQQENVRLLTGLAGETGATFAGSTQVFSDELRHAVIVRTRATNSVRVPFVGTLNLDIFGGSFTRNWQFWPGPPNPWE